MKQNKILYAILIIIFMIIIINYNTIEKFVIGVQLCGGNPCSSNPVEESKKDRIKKRMEIYRFNAPCPKRGYGDHMNMELEKIREDKQWCLDGGCDWVPSMGNQHCWTKTH